MTQIFFRGGFLPGGSPVCREVLPFWLQAARKELTLIHRLSKYLLLCDT
jgi:hypothetical protein